MQGGGSHEGVRGARASRRVPRRDGCARALAWREGRGPVPPAEQDAAAAVCAVEAACTAAGPVPLEPVGLGTFGRARDATLFLELAPAPGIMGMAERLRGELQGRGVAFDEKPFRPHVTIARRAQLCSGDLGALALPDPTLARCMTLFKSMLASAGAQYKPLFSAEVVAAGAASEGEALASGALKEVRS